MSNLTKYFKAGATLGNMIGTSIGVLTVAINRKIFDGIIKGVAAAPLGDIVDTPLGMVADAARQVVSNNINRKEDTK